MKHQLTDFSYYKCLATLFRGKRFVAIFVALSVISALSFVAFHASPAFAAYNTNTQEDNFLRTNQNGWGGSTNNDLVTQSSWYGDADGTHTYDSIYNNTARMAYSGTANTPNFAGTGTQHNGGDLLTEVSFSATGHQVFYLPFNFCGDKSCGYEARLDTVTGEIAIAKRSSNSTVGETWTDYTMTANTKYWVRFNYDGSGNLKMKVWQDGTLEPSSWNLTWTDTGTLLGSNYFGLASSQDQSTSDSISIYYYSYSSDYTVMAVPPTLNQPFGTQNAASDGTTDASGSYIVQNNEYNSSASMIATTDNRPNIIITSSAISNSTSDAPGAYPSTYVGSHYGTTTANDPFPLTVSSVETTGTVTTSVNTATISSGAWDDAYDIWFNNTSTGVQNTSGTNNLEMMIWLKSLGSVQPAGSKVASSISIGGNTYDVWYSGSANDTGGTVSYVLTSPTASLSSLDLGSLAADAVSRNYIDTGWYLYDIEHGFEIWQGGAGLSQNSFSVCVSGSC